jgi:NhaC family Na+:H+ antiporter
MEINEDILIRYINGMLTEEEAAEVKNWRAASLENTAIVIAPLIPWSIAGAVPVATIGAPESCVVAAVYLWMLPLWGILIEKVLRKTYPTVS